MIVLIPVLLLSLPHLDIGSDGVPQMDIGYQLSLLLLAIPLLYEFLFLVLVGATPGKSLLGLRVVRYVDGSHPAPFQLLLRVLVPALGDFFAIGKVSDTVAQIPAIYTMVVYGSAIFDTLGRGVHDKAAGTIVLRSR